ncbi:MAG: IS1595 family transposase, partial [Leptospiraceae bacterium]|nr:IS1595 family transposase [Leptospiraceae bacterium]
VVVTDEFRSYRKLNENRIHLVVDHSKEFAKGFVHTNGIEGFWSLLKRGIVGSYHKVSVKYLQHYVDEFTFRYSNRKNEAIFDTILKNCVIG